MMDALQLGDPARIGPFTLLGRLGAGGMGQVYLGRDGSGRYTAIKVIHPGLTSDSGFRGRFAHEIDAARRVRSPWTAAVIAAEPNADQPWLATEYVPGPNLSTHVELGGPLSEGATVMLAGRLAEALAHLHAVGVVHRDLKPSNVLLAPDGPRLIDFGVARATDATKITGSGALVGTPAFMSPEQAEGLDVGPASDVFSLASVLTFAATGHGPFGSVTSPMAMLLRITERSPNLSGVPPRLRPHLEECLAKPPGARPSAEVLATVLGPPAQAAAMAMGIPGPGAAVPVPSPTRPVGFPPPPSAMPHPGIPAPGARPRNSLARPAALFGGLVLVTAVIAALVSYAGGGGPGPTAPPDGPTSVQPTGQGALLGRIPTGERPQKIALSADGSRLYTANIRGITVIDTASGSATATIGVNGVAVALSPDGTRGYAPQLGGFLSVLDLTANTQIGAPPIAKWPNDVVVAPDGRTVYVAHSDLDTHAVTVTVFDTATSAVVDTIPVLPPDPARSGAQVHLAITPDGATLWLGGKGKTVVVIDTATRAVTTTIPVDRDGTDIVFAPGRAYLFNRIIGTPVLDTAAMAPIGNIRQDRVTTAMAAAPDGRYLFLAGGVLGDPTSILVIDAATMLTVGEIPVDAELAEMTVSPDGRTLYGAATEAGSVLVIDISPYSS